ncbi:elongation factor 4 [Candidatus Microgenomates bacterium]|nr:MAG: elongation factor 4 [Candidatus Microgenomates bacterium]
MNQKDIRNFAIIAHVDHGKSTLSDRLLEITGTIAKEKMREQFLDQNPISRERGITIKLAPVRMNYQTNILNLIDTPGHVDFSYEVSRTLAACEGAVLLVDATQNVQAQTVAHFNCAKKEGLTIIPAINKIDMPSADIEGTTKTLKEIFGFNEDEVVCVSAKTGENVKELLEKVIEKIPSPRGSEDLPLRALIFDAFYDEHKGVVIYVRIVDGEIKTGESIEFYQNKVKTEVKEAGFFTPALKSTEKLSAGEIGYIVTGIKDIRLCRVGDTVTIQNSNITPLPGYQLPKPMVFYGIYPKNPKDFALLRKGLEKICLNDTSLAFSEEYSAFLGSGFRVGFLGLLHAEIIKERLEQEDDLDLLLTMPQVLYEKKEDGSILEPYINLFIYTPHVYLGTIISLSQKRKGRLIDMVYHNNYVVLNYAMPYSMFIRGLASDIKSISSGFASVDYEFSGFEEADLVNLEILINEEPIDILSEFVYRDEAYIKAVEKVDKLKVSLPKRQFKQVVQAVSDNKILSRGEVSPFRKDVLKKMSGGDRTRKDKLLDKQKKGKKRMFEHSKIEIPQEVISSLIESR